MDPVDYKRRFVHLKDEQMKATGSPETNLRFLLLLIRQSRYECRLSSSEGVTLVGVEDQMPSNEDTLANR